MNNPERLVRIIARLPYFFLYGLLGLWLPACRDKSADDLRPLPDFIPVEVPANFPAPLYTFSENPVTREGFELGRMLFYEPRLSSDGTVSCGSCHRQAFAFADHSHDLSHGVGDQLGTRNTPALSNMIWQPEFFWDGGASHFELTPLNALTNPVEMGETLENVLNKLRSTPPYPAKFAAAFGQDTIHSQRLFRALAQFVGSMVSADSRYDRYVRHEPDGNLMEEEKAGMQLFQTKCASCHATDLFTDHSYRNNGLDEQHSRDAGREIITSDPADRGKFRVPSLRNVARTAPYMHDGRFFTLKRVLDHYASGVRDSPTLDPELKKDGRLGIALSDTEKTQLIAFMHTLTDEKFCTDPRFSEP